MHPILELRKKVDESHPGLGNLLAFGCLSRTAHQTLIIIAPAGCGKSTLGYYLQSQLNDVLLIDNLTKAGLTFYEDTFNNFRGTVVMDDLGKVDTDYTRKATLTTLTELVHSHFIERHTGVSHISIKNFFGTAFLNCQPIILKNIIRMAEWEANIQDKSVRYYHLMRPIDVSDDPPKMVLKFPDDDLEKVSVDFGIVANSPLHEYLWVQWGKARGQQHIKDYLKAVALWSGHKKVTIKDVEVLTALMNPVFAERYFIEKRGFESERYFLADYYYMMVEFASYGEFTLESLAKTYKMAPSSAYKAMQSYARMWTVVKKKPTTYGPSAETKRVLAEVMPSGEEKE